MNMFFENDQSKRNTPLLRVFNAVETKKGRKERGGREENRTKGGKKERRERKSYTKISKNFISLVRRSRRLYF